MAPNFFPVYAQLRFDPADESVIQVPIGPEGGRFEKLLSFNKIEASDIIAEAKKELSGDSAADKDLLSEHIRLNLIDITIRLRLAENGNKNTTEAAPTEFKSHCGFVAKVLLTNPRNPAQTKEKSMKVVAHSRQGIEEKKKLLEHMFQGVMSVSNRFDVAPEKLGSIFTGLCPENEEDAMMAGMGMGPGAMGDAMGQAMQGMMGGLAGAMGGAMGGGGGRGGRGGGGAPGGGDCKQQ